MKFLTLFALFEISLCAFTALTDTHVDQLFGLIDRLLTQMQGWLALFTTITGIYLVYKQNKNAKANEARSTDLSTKLEANTVVSVATAKQVGVSEIPTVETLPPSTKI